MGDLDSAWHSPCFTERLRQCQRKGINAHPSETEITLLVTNPGRAAIAIHCHRSYTGPFILLGLKFP